MIGPVLCWNFRTKCACAGARFVIEIFRETEEQNVAQEIEDRFLQRRVAPFRRDDGALDDGAILLAHRLAGRDVSAIDREAGDRFAHRAGQRVEGEIAEPAIRFREPVEHVAEHVDVVREREPHDQPFLRVNQMAEMHRVADETLERFRDRLLRGAVDQNIREQLREFVAGRAMDRPIFPERFVPGQDFLHQEINRAAILRKRNAEHGGAAPLQLLEILLRQIEAVRVIDPHAGHRAGADQLEQQFMRRVEHLRQFHPDRGEIVHVEEAPVVDLLGRDAPEGETIRLIVQELIERIEAPRLARRCR